MQFLVEKRREFKAKTKSPELPLQERLNLDRKQLGFKTMTNATGYGIYIEIHPQETKETIKNKNTFFNSFELNNQIMRN